MASTPVPPPAPRWLAPLKALLLTGTLLALLVPGSGASPVLPLLFGAPLLALTVWRRRDADFVSWTVCVLGFTVYVVVRAVGDETGIPTAYAYAVAADRALGLGAVPTVRLQELLYAPGAAGWLEWGAIGVHLSYYAVPLAVALFLWRRGGEAFTRYARAVGGMYLGGLVVNLLLPTAPPWLAAREGYLPPVHRILHDALYGVDPALWAYGSGVAAANDVAAMPSLHMAAAYMAALGLRRAGRAAGTLGALYAACMAFSLAYLGEHYLVDEAAGVALAVLSWGAAGALLRRRSPPAPLASRSPRVPTSA